MHIDAAKLDAALATANGNRPVLESFWPDQDGLAKPIVYDRLRTCTGRLVVVSGPQVLTVAKQHRGIVVPSGSNRAIVVADFAAMEARVFLYEAGHRCQDIDMYAALARDLFNNTVPRDSVKAAVLSELYGMSKHALGEKLGVTGDKLSEFVSTVKNHFSCRKLLDRVKKQYAKHGFIRNRYGRRVDVEDPLDHVLVNYYVQSTGCDVVLKGFDSLLNELEPRGVKPLYLLHDAVILDAPVDVIAELGTVKWVKVQGYVQKFPVRFEVQSCTP
jgi:DNA polymerase I-like protein with 3'-5' exonuclease and polymerase domains